MPPSHQPAGSRKSCGGNYQNILASNAMTSEAPGADGGFKRYGLRQHAGGKDEACLALNKSRSLSIEIRSGCTKLFRSRRLWQSGAARLRLAGPSRVLSTEHMKDSFHARDGA